MYAKITAYTIGTLIIAGTIMYLWSNSAQAIMKRNTEKLGELNQQIESLRKQRKEAHDEWERQDNILSGTINSTKIEYENLKLCVDAKSIDCESGKKEAMLQLLPTAYATTSGTASGAIVPPPERNSADEITKLQKQICDTVPTSPICTGKVDIRRIEKIANDTGVHIRFLIGITYAESHIGTNFAPQKCSYTHNWAGLKAYKYSVTEWAKGTRLPNANGCWLYEFNDPYQFFQSLANTIKSYYNANCSTPECVSQRFVGGQGVKRSWSYRVRLFYNP